MAAQFELKRNPNTRQYWWRLVSSNGRILADSGETYVNKSDCRTMLEWIKANAATIPIVDLTGV